MEFPDFKEYREQSHQQSRARKGAFDATRANSAGRSREQILELYEAELRARGLEIPPEEILDAQVDAITGDYRTIIRLMGREVGNAAKFVRGLFHPPF